MNTQIIESLLETSLLQFIEIGEEGNLATVEQAGLKLIFPLKSNDNEKDKRRISEQEIRFLFIRALDNAKDFEGYYAVEAPTLKKYRFTGIDQPSVTRERIKTGYISARIDVCLYNPKLVRTNLIEFKAHSASEKHVKKDILKLTKETGDNYFVHVFKSINCKTLQATIEIYRKSIEHVWLTDECENSCNKLTFYICVKSWSLILKKTIVLNHNLDSKQLLQEFNGKVNGSKDSTTIDYWDRIK